MLIVGIDIGKYTHEAGFINAEGHQLGNTVRFSNSIEGYQILLEAIELHSKLENEVIIGIESTGQYWLSLYSALQKEGFTLCVINPIQSDSMRKTSIRKTKTDSIDSLIIAQTVRMGRYTPSSNVDEDTIALKQLCRLRFSFQDSISEIKLKVITLLDQVFPEYRKLFSDTFGKASMELLLNHPTPDEIAALDTDELVRLLSECSRGRFGIDKANKVQSAASSSFGVKYAQEAFSFQIHLLLEQIKFIEGQINELDEQISKIYESKECFLDTIPGIGKVLACTIFAEIGDVSRFGSDPAKLVAFAGIDPSVYQSGNFTGTNGHMSKRGSPYLRRAIWLAAMNARLCDPVLGAFYDKKRAEGKPFMVAIGAVARKLTYIIFAVLRDKKVYVPQPN